MNRYVVMGLLIGLGKLAGAQTPVSRVAFSDPAFVRFFDDYVAKNGLGQTTERGVPAMYVMSRSAGRRCELVISMLGRRSQLIDNPPGDYVWVGNRLVLLYTGLETVYTQPPAWHARLLRLIGTDLCDDTVPPPPGARTYPIGCAFAYDPLVYKLTFENGKLIDQHLFFGAYTR